MTVRDLRAKAKADGVVGYSRMRRSEIEHLLKLVVVRRGDLKLTRKLGSAYLRTCKVYEWEGCERYGYKPLSWLVPRFKLGGVEPRTWGELAEASERRSAAASQAYSERLNRAASRVGAPPGSRVARAVMFNRIDDDLAELIAFKTAYRHEHTDYDRLIGETGDKDYARSCATEAESPDDWEMYRRVYGFDSDEARDLASVLEDPDSAHPIWFKEAEIAVRRAGLDGTALTYEVIRAAIEEWRGDREQE